MIHPVYKFCSACQGLGKVEGPTVMPRNRNNQLDKGSEEPISPIVPCYVCHGKKYIPTGFFTITPDDIVIPFDHQLNRLSTEDIKAIKTRI
jgi:hypothetical protein